MEACRESGTAKFSTYAYYYVLGEVTKYVREDKALKISRETVKLKQSISRAKDTLRQKLLREPTTLELSLILDMDEEQILRIEAITADVKSLDYSDLDVEMDLYSSIGVMDHQMDSSILDLKESIKNLDEEEKRLIVSRYYRDLTQQETSRELGISQVQVSRKEAKILQKLRANM